MTYCTFLLTDAEVVHDAQSLDGLLLLAKADNHIKDFKTEEWTPKSLASPTVKASPNKRTYGVIQRLADDRYLYEIAAAMWTFLLVSRCSVDGTEFAKPHLAYKHLYARQERLFV